MGANIKEDKFAESKRLLLDLNAAKNEDVVLKLLARDKAKYNKVTDYICDAIRAFGNNSTSNVDMDHIETVIEKMMDKKLKNLNIADERAAESQSLEDNLDGVNDDED